MPNAEQILNALNQPLDRERVKQLSKGGRSLDYLETYDVINKLNEVFGFDGWTDTVVCIKSTVNDTLWYAQVELTAKIGEEWVKHADVGRCATAGAANAASVDTAIAGAVSDALKRAARKFGRQFGNDLYDKDPQPVSENYQNDSYAPRPAQQAQPRQQQAQQAPAGNPDEPNCPNCGGGMWDNSTSEFWNGGIGQNGKMKPRYVCKNKKNGCSGVVWPQRSKQSANGSAFPVDINDTAPLEDDPFGD